MKERNINLIVGRREEQAMIARDLLALQADPSYIQEVENLENSHYSALPVELAEWWRS